MRKYFILMVAALLSTVASAQNWNEWFRQKKTQIRYLTEQIAALKVYGDYARKGYNIAKGGLGSIGEIKQGDRAMHQQYLASQVRVNPRVKNYWKVAELTALQLKIVRACQRQKRRIQNNATYTADERVYISKLLSHLLTGSSDIIEQLIILIQDHSSEMKDDERLKRVDNLYREMQDRYSFVKSFGAETDKLGVQRLREVSDIKTSRSLFGIH